MSVDYKNAAKISDLTRLMTDEPPPEQRQKEMPTWQGASIDSILDDLSTMAMPREYLGYGDPFRTREAADDERYFARRMQGFEYYRRYPDPELVEFRQRETRSTLHALREAAFSVRGIEHVEVEEVGPGRVNVYVTRVSLDLDTMTNYRDRIEYPVLTAVRSVAAAGVTCRVYVRTPLIVFAEACERARLELQRRLAGVRIDRRLSEELPPAIRTQVRRFLGDYTRFVDDAFIDSVTVTVQAAGARALPSTMRYMIRAHCRSNGLSYVNYMTFSTYR